LRLPYDRTWLPGELNDYVVYAVEKRILGHRSVMGFVAGAIQDKVLRLIEAGFIPKDVPKARKPPKGSIGELNSP
jgi:hypothetical protein